ncbi:MAG: hypothetical protein WC761_01195 [Candidatus Paceibacterota bacterium]
MTIIKDGKGTGVSAQVDSNNRIRAYAISTAEESSVAIENGENFILSMEQVFLTGSSESAMCYIKNTSQLTTYVFELCVINYSQPTTTAGSPQVIFYKNPTTGSLVQSASAGRAVSSNLSSNKTPAVTFYVASGSAVSSLSDGTVLFKSYISGPRTPLNFLNTIILGPGNSIGTSIIPQPNNTLMSASIHWVMFASSNGE